MIITSGIVAKVEESIAVWEKSDHSFSWPDDSCIESWYYDFHMLWVAAFNASDRELDAGAFLRQWMKEQEKVTNA